MTLRKSIALLSALICLFSLIIPADAKSVNVSAESAILIDADTQFVMYEKNADLRLPMASTTKIMTAIIALEYGHLDEKFEIPVKAIGVEGSSMYLVAGEHLTIRELVYGLLLESANDAAVALAHIIAGGTDDFAALMNKKAEKLGLTDTHFTNPHGLDNSEHYTTAKELAHIASYCMKNDLFREAVSSRKKIIDFNDGEGKRFLVNHNRMLRHYRDAIGVKTGYTKKSGRCLVSAAERDGMTLIAVTLNAPDDWNDHTQMLDYGFDNYIKAVLCKNNSIRSLVPVVGGVDGFTYIGNSDTYEITLPKTHGDIIYAYEVPRFIFAPTNIGDKVGRAVVYCDGNVIAEIPLFCEFAVEKYVPKFSLMRWLKSIFQRIG